MSGVRANSTIASMIREIASLVLPLPVIMGVYAVAPMDPQRQFYTSAVMLLGLLVFLASMAWSLVHVTRSARPMVGAVAAVLVTVPLLVAVFAYGYALHSVAHPDAYSEPLTKIDALYFATSTFATVGFGDVTATSQVSRLIVTVQIAIDLAVIGGLVRLYLTLAQERRRQGQA